MVSRFVRKYFLVGTLLAAFLSACSGRDGAESPQEGIETGQKANAEALVGEWFELSRSPKENLNNPRCRKIALELLQIGPEELKPIFEVIAEPDSTIETKVLAVASLDCVIVPGVLPWLTTLVSPELSADTRACATQLLAVSRDPSVLPTLRACAGDCDKRVRLAALVGLMAQGDAEARKKLVEQFQAEGVGRNERARILTSFLTDPQPEDLPLFLASMEDASLPAELRMQAIGVVGRLGDDSAVEALERLSRNEQSEDIRNIAKDAAAAIPSRKMSP